MTNRLRIPHWRLPPGVAAGTWEYTQRDSIAAEYASFLDNTPLIAIDVDLAIAALPPPGANRTTRVADLGCGDGRALRRLWECGFDVLGIDLSQPMLSRAKTCTGDEAMSDRLIRANLVQLDGIINCAVDHAICLFSTIGMIRGRLHRQAFLRHVARIVCPGGRLVLHVHNRNDAWRSRPTAAAYVKSLVDACRDRDCELGDRVYPYRGLGDMFLHTYSRRELRRDLERTGWNVQTITALSSTSHATLANPDWISSLRAGGFVAVACRS